MKSTELLLTSLLIGSTHAASVIPLGIDQANSSGNAFGGSLEKTLDDGFAYNPNSPVSPLPNQVYNAGSIGYHANLGEGEDAFLSYTTPSFTTNATETVIVVDLYGRVSLACCNDRDDNIDVQLFNGSFDSPIATVTGLAIDNDANGWARATFDTLPVGTTFDRLRIIGHDSGGGASNNYFTLLETRASSLAQIPEPSSAALLSLCSGMLLLRRRK
jgi:hypothetical protein